ncbi:WD40 repeat-like protein [Athelia psychrophila]|uniref:WD40 repeat-like protein n=1 Tax=Athelia psychrophila TaxID=1759441 RepID=A0A165Y776_9AGAM|nr:WD40 repeat-like protein [Fibularhizoctonia sp. CBS 109695]
MSVVPRFGLLFTLEGHRKSLNALAISPDGSKMLSGGDDAELFVWSLSTGAQLQKINFNFYGPITSLAWIANEAFAFGCSNGSILIYTCRGDQSDYSFASHVTVDPGRKISAIEDITFHASTRRLAVVCRGTFWVWDLTDSYDLVLVNEPPPASYAIARNVRFNLTGDTIWVFYLEDHTISCYSVKPFIKKWSKIIPSRIGSVALSADQKTMLVCNLQSGIDSYSMSWKEPVMNRGVTYAISMRKWIIVQVTYALQGQWIISGSDDGNVQIFDVSSGGRVQCLRHAGVDTKVQVVTAISDATTCTVASGSTSPGPSDIKVWRHEPSTSGTRRWSFSLTVWHLCCIAAGLSVALNILVFTFRIDDVRLPVSWRDIGTHGPSASGKKGYQLKEVFTNADSPHNPEWTREEFIKAQKFVDTLIVEYLDVEVSRTSQKPKSLENLRTKLLETYPIIGQGEKDWVSDFVAAGLKREQQKKKQKETAKTKK